jgi:hypothetical protein
MKAGSNRFILFCITSRFVWLVRAALVLENSEMLIRLDVRYRTMQTTASHNPLAWGNPVVTAAVPFAARRARCAGAHSKSIHEIASMRTHRSQRHFVV